MASDPQRNDDRTERDVLSAIEDALNLRDFNSSPARRPEPPALFVDEALGPPGVARVAGTFPPELPPLDEPLQVARAYLDKYQTKSQFERWLPLLGFVFLLLAFAVGVASAIGTHTGNNWGLVSIAGAASSLGFGTAIFIYQLLRKAQRRTLEADLVEAKLSAHELLLRLDKLHRNRTVQPTRAY